jgi:Xaa-Pro dipeptidase
MNEHARITALMQAEKQAEALFDAIEAAGLVAAGRSERVVEQDIYALAEQSFGVTRHWHKRMVRSGPNTLCVAADNPPVREIADGDTVFIDLGPVFEEWEADVGRTYVLADDPGKQQLLTDLPRIFDELQQYYDQHDDVTGAELYRHAENRADAAGWRFGGTIAGHIVGEFPHAHIPGDKDIYRISPANPTRLRDPDALGQTRYWILEVHLVDRDRTYGGFYERLLVPPALRTQ